MDNNWNVSTAVVDTFIEEAYEGYITALFYMSALALVFYAALSKLPEEVEHIWFRPFSLTTLLYIFARYAVLTWAGLIFFVIFLPLGRSCNIYINAADSMTILSNFGTQGLLSARAYSLCKGAKILTMSLVSCFLAQLIILLYDFIRFPGCSAGTSVGDKLIFLSQNIVGIIADVIIFGICMWKVWGTWKLKCQAGIQSGRSLVYIILKQSILRCCFVIAFTITETILFAIYFVFSSDSDPFIPQDLNIFINVLSGILVADFTLDLRRLNSAKITASNVSLPTLQFSNVLQHAHQSILVEMATPEEEEDDTPESANVMDIQPVQE